MYLAEKDVQSNVNVSMSNLSGRILHYPFSSEPSMPSLTHYFCRRQQQWDFPSLAPWPGVQSFLCNGHSVFQLISLLWHPSTVMEPPWLSCYFRVIPSLFPGPSICPICPLCSNVFPPEIAQCFFFKWSGLTEWLPQFPGHKGLLLGCYFPGSFSTLCFYFHCICLLPLQVPSCCAGFCIP